MISKDRISNLLKVAQGRLEEIRKDRLSIILLVIFAVAAILHFRNFYEVGYLSLDEARAFTLRPSGPMIFLLCRPIYAIFLTKSSVFYVAAFFGFMSVIIFYRICRLLFDKKFSVLATLFFAFFPFRINFTRHLYPAVFVNFFLLLLILTLLYSILRRKPPILIASGAFSTILFFIHPSVYSMHFGIGVSLLCLWWIKGSRSQIGIRYILRSLKNYIIGAIGTYVLLEAILFFANNGYSYTKQIFFYHDHVASYLSQEGNMIVNFISTFFKEMTYSARTILRSLFVVAALTATVILAFKEKKKELLFFIIAAVAGVGILFAVASLDVHAVACRHFVWLCPLFSVAIASFVTSLMYNHKIVVKKLILLCAAAFIISSLWESYMVTEETFRVDGIKEWLKENNIDKGKVITYLKLYSPGDTTGVTKPPITSDVPLGHLNYTPKLIWKPIYHAHRLGKLEYIIPSGMGPNSRLAQGDIMLKNVKPMKSWVHPYANFKYRFFGRKLKMSKPSKPEDFISVYSLRDVFSADNFKALKKSAKQNKNLQ